MSAIPQFVCAYPRLSEIPEGTQARVVLFRVDRDEERRLAGMGIRVGSLLQLLRRQPNGPSLIAVGDARMALGASTAAAIVVAAVVGGEPAENPGLRSIEDMAVGESGHIAGFRKGSSA